MEEKRGNIVLGIILAILMIIAIVIVIINPNKIEKTAKVTPETQNETKIENNTNNNIEQINSQEENETSMQVGGNFCKIGDKAIFYADKNKSIYMYSVNENTTTKIATIEKGANKIYFD